MGRIMFSIIFSVDYNFLTVIWLWLMFGTACWAKRNLGVRGPNFESEVHQWADVVSLGVLLRKGPAPPKPEVVMDDVIDAPTSVGRP